MVPKALFTTAPGPAAAPAPNAKLALLVMPVAGLVPMPLSSLSADNGVVPPAGSAELESPVSAVCALGMRT